MQIHPSINDLAGIWGKSKVPARPLSDAKSFEFGRRLMLKLRERNLHGTYNLCVTVRAHTPAPRCAPCRKCLRALGIVDHESGRDSPKCSDGEARSRQSRTEPPSTSPTCDASPSAIAVLEQEILALFIEQAPVTIDALKHAHTKRDWSIAAHTLKGSARAVGAWRAGRDRRAPEAVGAAPGPTDARPAGAPSRGGDREARAYIDALNRQPKPASAQSSRRPAAPPYP